MTGIPKLGRDASGVPPTDLSSLFASSAAVPDRTQGVPRLTSPSGRPDTKPTVVPTPQPDHQPQPAAANEPPARRPRRTATRAVRASTKKHPSSVVVYLPISLRNRLRTHSGNTGRSYTQLVFDALNATHTRLAELAAASDTPLDDEPTDGLFVAQQPARRTHGEDLVQVSIRPNPTNLAVIDGLAEQHTRSNRSALVALALDEFLPPA